MNFLACCTVPHSLSRVLSWSACFSVPDSLRWSVSCSPGSPRAKGLWSLRLELFTQLVTASRISALPFEGAKTPEESCLLNTGHASGPEARCAALREEFLAFRRRRDASRARLPAYQQSISYPEQATLL